MTFLKSQISQSSKFKHPYLQSLDFWVARRQPCQHFCLICSFGSCRIYSLDFFCGVFSLLLLAGGDFRGRCVALRSRWKCWLMQFWNCWWWYYRGNCYVLDHVLSSERFAGHLTGTCGEVRVGAMVIHWGLMSCLFCSEPSVALDVNDRVWIR